MTHLRKILSIILLFVISLGIAKTQAQSSKKTMFKFPDTGLQTSFTITYGEDHDYTINPPLYKSYNQNIILDSNTLLMWQKNDGGEMSIEWARKYCDTLTLGGFTDWRLPTALEAYSLINIQKTPPAINTTYFTNTGAEYWWTSETQFGDTNKIWVTNAGGGIGNHSKLETLSAGGTKKFHVRAVRNTFSHVIENRFSVNGNLVFDSLSSLIWLQIPDTTSRTWEEALIYAENFSFGSHDNWRLPNIKELQSLVDINTANPAFQKSVFLNAITGHFWSSTTTPNQIDKAWYLDSRFGITTYALKTVKKKCWLVSSSKQASAIKNSYKNCCNTIIYPNPNNGEFYVQLPPFNTTFSSDNEINPTIIYSLKIFYPTGLLVKEISLNSLLTPVKLNQFVVGNYFIEISGGCLTSPIHGQLVIQL
jgi:hypothetical protein